MKPCCLKPANYVNVPDRYGRRGWEGVECAQCRKFLGCRPIQAQKGKELKSK